MNFRLTAILFGVMLVLGLGLLGLALWDDDKAVPTDLLFPDLAGDKAEQIAAVEIARPDGGKLVLKRTGKDQWAVAEPVAARADASAVTAVINALLQAKPTAYSELQNNPAVHGLDKPLAVTLTNEAGKAGTLNVGDVTIGGAKAVAFVTTPARKRPMAVPRSAVDALLRESARSTGHATELAKWVSDYRTKAVFAADARTGTDDVTAITLAAKGKTLALAKAGNDWKFVAPAGWGDAALAPDAGTSAAPGAIAGVRALLNAVVTLQAGSADDFLPDPKDLKEYGLDPANPDAIRVEIKSKDGPPEVAFIGKKADAAPVVPGTPGKVYVRVEGTPGVVRVNAPAALDGLAALVADPAPLRDRDLLRDDVRGRVEAIDLTTGGQTVKFRKAAGATEWKLYGGPNDPQPAAPAPAAALLGIVAQPRVVKEFPAADDAAFAGAELKAEMKVWTEGLEPAADTKAEPKPKGIPVTFQFGRKDAAGVRVRRILPSGAKADFVIADKLKLGTDPAETDVVAAVTRTRLAFLDPALAKFSPFVANRLTVSQGAAVAAEVEFDKTADPASFPTGRWQFVQPAAQKGRAADAATMTDLLTMLSNQSAGAFVAEQPSDPDLAKWGLDPKAPRAKIVVGLDTGGAAEADKQRVYYLGNDSEKDAGQVYARQDGRSVVFLFPKLVFERFTTADLRDKTILRFDKAKVKSIRLRGWRAATGVPTEFKFERKGADWVAVTPAGFPVDGAKVNAFLALLDGLRAKAFVPGPMKPEHGFPPEAEGLDITLEIEGTPGLALNLAAPTDGGASYFLHAGSLPENERVVTVAADPFKPFKEKPAAFAK